MIYEGTTFTLTCSIELFEEMSNLMTLNVTWTGPAGAPLTGTLSGSGTSYTSTSTADTPASYTCSARLVASHEHLTFSTEAMNAITVVTGELDVEQIARYCLGCTNLSCFAVHNYNTLYYIIIM